MGAAYPSIFCFLCCHLQQAASPVLELPLLYARPVCMCVGGCVFLMVSD